MIVGRCRGGSPPRRCAGHKPTSSCSRWMNSSVQLSVSIRELSLLQLLKSYVLSEVKGRNSREESSMRVNESWIFRAGHADEPMWMRLLCPTNEQRVLESSNIL